jgi:hypothetical protein
MVNLDENQSKFECSFCNKKYVHNQSLDKHLKTCKEKIKDEECMNLDKNSEDNKSQDAYLTGNPQMPFFKVQYKRHTEFACEAIKDTPTSGNKATVEITRCGDLITRILK